MEVVNKDEIRIFTDGSANPQQKTGGWAALVMCGTEEFMLKGHDHEVTHQQMELQAVISALKFVKEKFNPQQAVVIYTDSQYVVRLPERKDALQANDYKSKKGKAIANSSLLREFYQLSVNMRLTIEKIPAHQKSNSGYDENRRVDQLARKIVRQGNF